MSTAALAFDWKTLSANSVASVNADLLPTSIELPALPQAVTEFVKKSSKPNFNVTELSGIVEKDTALTVELLKHVNSAMYALRSPIRCVRDAIVHVGINSARLHLLAVGMKAATRALQTRLVNHRNFWNESLQKALFAREIARRMKLDPGLAFLGGLLQDYLLPVLTNIFDKQYVQFLEVSPDQREDLTTWERKTLGFDHASAGAYYAAQWQFPPDLLCAIFYHHSPEQTLQGTQTAFFNLFPVALASLLPDQLRQSPTGMQTLLQVACHCPTIDLTEICRTVDVEQMKLAEGYETPNHLSELLNRTRRQEHTNRTCGLDNL
ncbi:MAG TPA: HDOD domain-containing protein [Planctomycetaceae bacterium]|nr:HDOD domain-containing protein [Planctomycetaceae bacterium]